MACTTAVGENSVAVSDSPVLRLFSFRRRAVSAAGSTGSPVPGYRDGAMASAGERGGCLGRLLGQGCGAEPACTTSCASVPSFACPLLTFVLLFSALFVPGAGLLYLSPHRVLSGQSGDSVGPAPGSCVPSEPWDWNPVRGSRILPPYTETPVPPSRCLPPGLAGVAARNDLPNSRAAALRALK